MNMLKNNLAVLAQINFFRAHSIASVQQQMAGFFGHHKLDYLGVGELNANFSSAEIQRISFIHIKGSGAVRTCSCGDNDYFSLQIPIKGDVYVQVDRENVHCHPGCGWMLSPNSRADMTFSEPGEQLIIRVERTDMERQLEQQIGRELDTPLEFTTAVPFAKSSRARHILELLRFMMMSMEDERGIAISTIARENMASLLLSSFLTLLEHNYRGELFEHFRDLKPKHIRKAQQYIQAHFREAIVPADIAKAADISERCLFFGFKQYLGITPMRYLKNLRLDTVHSFLRQSNRAQVSISNIAMDFGFNHMGHFCTDYKARFGEQPRNTLQCK